MISEPAAMHRMQGFNIDPNLFQLLLLISYDDYMVSSNKIYKTMFFLVLLQACVSELSQHPEGPVDLSAVWRHGLLEGALLQIHSYRYKHIFSLFNYC